MEGKAWAFSAGLATDFQDLASFLHLSQEQVKRWTALGKR